MKSNLFSFLTSRLASCYVNNIEPSNTASNNSNISLRAESILIEEFHRANIASYKNSDELSSTFNIYLLTAGIILSSTIALQTLYFQIASTQANIPITLDVVSAVIFFLGAFMGFFFLNRFIILSHEVFINERIINKIKNYYINYFKNELPYIEELLNKQKEVNQFRGIPSYIFYTINIFGSSCFGGVWLLALGYILDFVDYGQIVNRMFVSGLELIIAFVSTIFIFFLFFILYLYYYKYFLNQLLIANKDG